MRHPHRTRSVSSLKPNPRQIYLDRLTKWPGKGKAVEHAQQNVNVAGPRSPLKSPVRPAGLGTQVPSNRASFAQILVPDAWKSPEFGQSGLCSGSGGGPYGFRKAFHEPAHQDKGPQSMTDALKLGFGNFVAPAKSGPSGVLVVFCDDALKLGPATRKTLGSSCRTGRSRRQGRTFHRQEKHGASAGCPRGSQGRAAGRHRGRQGQRAEAAGCPQAWRSRAGQAAERSQRRDNLC